MQFQTNLYINSHLLQLQMASVYVRGFPKRTGQRDLEKFFSQIGSVNEVRMVRDFAFIVFKERDKARDAVEKMNGQNFDGQVLTVELSKERSGPQPNDVCRSCYKKGHWKTNCPENRNRRRRGRSSSRSSSSRSRSASFKSKQKRKKHKKSNKRHSKKKYESSKSSDSSDSSSSSRSRSRSHSSQSSKFLEKKKRY